MANSLPLSPIERRRMRAAARAAAMQESQYRPTPGMIPGSRYPCPCQMARQAHGILPIEHGTFDHYYRQGN